MFASEALAALAAKPLEPELPKVAGLAALLAAGLSAVGSLVQGGGLREYLPILALIILVTLGVFVWGVPSALDLAEPWRFLQRHIATPVQDPRLFLTLVVDGRRRATDFVYVD
jgi:hypothetical protein